MSTRSFVGTALLSLAAAGLFFAAPVQAQRRGGGGHSGGAHFSGGHYGGAHYGGGYYGGRGYYGGYGYRGDWDRFRGGYPWYGLGLGLGYGSYPYSYGYYPYSYGYGPDYYADTSPGYVDYGTYSVSPDTYSYAAPATGYQSFYPPATTGADTGAAAPASGSDAVIRVRVPDPDASLWFEGVQTTQRGTDRTFESPPLAPDRAYSYDIRARWNDNGRPVEETRHVRVHAGDRVTVDFSAAPPASEGAAAAPAAPATRSTPPPPPAPLDSRR
jgi:uncharacterized protein (TIGR03000 family)